MVLIDQFVVGESAMEQLGAELAGHLSYPSVVFLRGDLGAGKTTLVRGLLHQLGWSGPVKSPTYTLVETYRLDGVDYHHFDLYRLADPEELEFLGIRDYLQGASVCFFEWPERGAGIIPAPNLDIFVEYQEDGRRIRCVDATL